MPLTPVPPFITGAARISGGHCARLAGRLPCRINGRADKGGVRGGSRAVRAKGVRAAVVMAVCRRRCRAQRRCGRGRQESARSIFSSPCRHSPRQGVLEPRRRTGAA